MDTLYLRSTQKLTSQEKSLQRLALYVYKTKHVAFTVHCLNSGRKPIRGEERTQSFSVGSG